MGATVDVLVIGSGAAGLASALAARKAGATVRVIERASRIGGTSAMSGGVLWVPGHPYRTRDSVPDSAADALEYLRAATLGEVSEAPLEAYLREAPAMLSFLEEHTTLKLRPRSDHPDYLPARIGGRIGRGIEPCEWDFGRLGEFAGKVRQSPSGWRDALLDVEKTKLAKNEWRAGRALVGALLHACLSNDIPVGTDTRAVRLETRNDRVVGAWIAGHGPIAGEELIEVNGGVILATGGFEWDAQLVQAFLGTPMDSPVSSPANTGDGLRMAMTVGARLGNMSQAWWTPALRVDNQYYEDGPLNRFVTQERSKPGSIVVNRSGRRFARETLNYNDFGKAMTVFDGADYTYPNSPAFLIFDEQCRRSYAMVGVEPADASPDWMNESSSLDELAAKLGLDAVGLRGQVAEYNRDASGGEDPRYHRGDSEYERYAGDPSQGGNGTIRPLGDGPYYGLEMRLGALGTKGGPVLDLESRVVDVDGKPIAGLFAAGNVAASIMGASYPGPGVTLGPAIVHALRAGRAAARDAATDADR